ncbi:MAG TPA: TM2 domain-containing protein [Myxococcota bacterium]|nr:TM2 domain-containing protein [Myxococcota bacterium]
MANFCQTCGAQASAGRFCASCGAQLTGGLAQKQAPAPAPAPAQEVIDPNTSDVDWTVCLLLNLFLGLLGVHRFYSGHIVIGFIQLMTGGMCGIWTIVDLILIVSGTYTDAQGRPLKR